MGMTGYILSVSAPKDQQRRITDALHQTVSGMRGCSYQIAEQDAFVIKFSLKAPLSAIFQLGEKLVQKHGATDFVVSQITLEDAFLRLTADQVAPKHVVVKQTTRCCGLCAGKPEHHIQNVE